MTDTDVVSLITLIRKQPAVTTAAFTSFMEHEYGPTYARMPQVLEYVQYYVVDEHNDGTEDPIDAVVRITFSSERAMHEALASEDYRAAHEARAAFMRPTTVGIHSVRIQRSVQLSGARSC